MRATLPTCKPASPCQAFSWCAKAGDLTQLRGPMVPICAFCGLGFPLNLARNKKGFPLIGIGLGGHLLTSYLLAARAIYRGSCAVAHQAQFGQLCMHLLFPLHLCCVHLNRRFAAALLHGPKVRNIMAQTSNKSPNSHYLTYCLGTSPKSHSWTAK